MQFSAFVFVLFYLAAIAVGSPHSSSQTGHVCGDLTAGKGCSSPGVKACCSENSPTVVACNDDAKIEFEFCTGGRICAPDEEGTSVACFFS